MPRSDTTYCIPQIHTFMMHVSQRELKVLRLFALQRHAACALLTPTDGDALCTQIGHMMEILPLVSLLIGVVKTPSIPGELIKASAPPPCRPVRPAAISMTLQTRNLA